MGALRKTEVQIHVFFFLLCIVHLCMMEQISFIFFSSNHSFHPENKGFLVIIEFNFGLSLGKELVVFQEQRLCEVKQKII